MPEIKHNFLKGKMNKDLDERLVPNGEYRDAMNIQVSTSEGSEVGTVQNILGNSLVTGQGFISKQAFCVGSIADEKNDKLYYFVTQKELLGLDGSFENESNGWYAEAGWSFGSAGATYSGGDYNYIELQLPSIIEGETYRITFTNTTSAGNPLVVYLGGTNTSSPHVNTVGLQSVDLIAGSTNSNLRFRAGSAGTRWNGTIDNISVFDADKPRSAIVEYDSKTNSITPVFVDTAGDVLQFSSDRLITGINIIDDMLFWTDNYSEPKKINITRSIQGTDSNGLTHTKLVVKDELLENVKEEHITVIKKAPPKAPAIKTTTATNSSEAFASGDLLAENYFYPFNTEVAEGDEMWIGINNEGGTSNSEVGTPPDLKVGDILRIYNDNGVNNEDNPQVARFTIKNIAPPGQFRYSQIQNNFATIASTDSVIAWTYQTAVKVKVSTLVAHTASTSYTFDLEENNEGVFERIFPRFACRYRYEDNEYSSVGPFSEVVFIPGEFSYHPTKAYNEGMINTLKTLTLQNFVPTDIPKDVVQVDLLYKNEFAPNIYVVKSINKNSDEWNDTNGTYTITTENIYAQIPSNQLIRPWDNVPKTALAQEITGNRIVYGNYTQGYDFNDNEFKISTKLHGRLKTHSGGKQALKSIKSQRTYNVGVVYGDKYGRETPVFTNDTANQKITKNFSSSSNAISVSIDKFSDLPDWADYYKVFIKETSNEYYNLAMGRIYDAEDGNVWISFPSIDRNKVDEDTYLTLKKAVGKDAGPVLLGEDYNPSGRYKIVAIENEAPDYIKTEYTLLAETNKKVDGFSLFGGKNKQVDAPAFGPTPGARSFTIDKQFWLAEGDENHELGLSDLETIWGEKRDADIYVSFSNRNVELSPSGLTFSESPIVMSQKFKVINVVNEEEETATNGYTGHELYKITLTEVIPQSLAWLTKYLTSINASSEYQYGGRLRPHFYKKEVINKPEFDGRFFVKIIEDELLTKSLRVNEVTSDTGWELVDGAISNLFYLKDGSGGTTGNDKSTTFGQWRSNYGNASSGKWFIDETYYAGSQPNDNGHPKDSEPTQDGVNLSDITSQRYFLNFNLGPLSNYDNNAGNSNNLSVVYDYYKDPTLTIDLEENGNGQSRGIAQLKGAHSGRYITADLGDLTKSAYEDSTTTSDSVHTGGHFLSLSYGYIDPRPNDDHFQSKLGSTSPQYSAGRQIFPRRGVDFLSGFEDEKNWVVGEDGGSNSFTSGQEDIVSNLSPNKLFRLQGDNNIYKIKGVTKRRLYNYMGAMYWNGLKGLPAYPFVGEQSGYNYDEYTGSGSVVRLPPSPGYSSSSNIRDSFRDNWVTSTSNYAVGLGKFLDAGSFVYEDYENASWEGYNNNPDPRSVHATLYEQNLQLATDDGDLVGFIGDVYWPARTSVMDQHYHMTQPENCRVNYLINYEVLDYTQNPLLSSSDGDGLPISDTTTFQNLDTADDTCRLEFVKEFSTTKKNVLTKFPAIFETEPTEDLGLDIYYEASGKRPVVITPSTIDNFIQIGATIETIEGSNGGTFVTGLTSWFDNVNGYRVNLSNPTSADDFGEIGEEIKFYNDDGSFVIGVLNGFAMSGASEYFFDADGNEQLILGSSELVLPGGGSVPTQVNAIFVTFKADTTGLDWFNCWSFGNGVESNRIGDTYNKPYITNGVKASTTLLEEYKEERREHGLIYSGIYNSTSGVNDLNQFIAAEKITKDVNPIYGSIQKLHSRSTADGDLIALCEDRILKILANKDALFNADGNPQLIANNNVLGQTIPFSGEYGISTNPESFASESYRVYFTDRVRGAVMRLSKDGLTPISEHGMKDWFKDNLSLGVTNLLGENNLALQANWDIPSSGNCIVIDGEAYLGYYNNDPTDSDRFGRPAKLIMLDVMEVGKTYRIRYDVVSNGANSNGLTLSRGIVLQNSNIPYDGWISAADSANSVVSGATVDETFVTNRANLEFIQYQVNSSNQAPTSGYSDTLDSDGNVTQTALQKWVADQGYTGSWGSAYFYGGEATIKNIVLEEVKDRSLKLIGSHDDKKSEYNLTIHGETSNTISFKENVKGWVSFKSFTPENAISCANDYYTMKEGKLWQHHNPGINRNTFYNEFANSSFDVLLNDMPSSIKSYHALDYEGSQSRVEGIKTVEITGIQHSTGSAYDGKYAFFEVSEMSNMINDGEPGWSGTTFLIKQYRNNVLISERLAKAWSNVGSSLTSPSGGPTKGHMRYETGSGPGDFQVGDTISTQLQEDSISYFNSFAKDGWYVSGIKTDKEKGSLLEFIEKEGKWFNYISGVKQNVDSDFDFGSFDVQGLGIVQSVDGNDITINGDLNASLQVGDIIYYEQPSQVLQENILDTNLFSSTTIDLTGSGNDGYTIVNDTTVVWYPTTNTPSGVNFFNNITTENITIGDTYLGTLEVSNYSGTNTLGFSTSGGVSGGLRVHQNDVDANGYAKMTEYFVATANSKPDFFARSTNSGTIKGSIQKVVPGGSLGFTQIQSNQLQKVGVITAISDNIITMDVGATLPSQGDYCMFIKNQVINMSGLSGYYANAKFENNSKTKAELFSVSSEISESSK